MTSRLTVLGIGKFGHRVVEVLDAAEVRAELLKLESLEAQADANDVRKVRRIRGFQDPGNETASSLLFVAGSLEGNLLEVVQGITPLRSADTQIVIIGVLPPSFLGQPRRAKAIEELESLTAANCVVLLLNADEALRELNSHDPLIEHVGILASKAESSIVGIADLVRVSGEVNVDLADVLMLLRPGSVGLQSTGFGEGEDRVEEATAQLLRLADHFPIGVEGVPGCLIHIAGDMGLSIDEVTRTSTIIQEAVGNETEIIFGAVHEPSRSNSIRVTALWTGYMPSVDTFERTGSFLEIPGNVGRDVHLENRKPLSRTIKVFLASPSDVEEEREAAKDIVDELNVQHSSRWGTHLELIRWETHAIPAMGRAQEVVTETTDLQSVDIFVGILWSRLGTPTEESVSGTVEEFNRAYDSWRKHGRPWISFYFCNRPVSPTGVEGARQYLGVAEFKDGFPEKGLYFTYDTVERFQQLLARHLLRITEELLSKRHAT